MNASEESRIEARRFEERSRARPGISRDEIFHEATSRRGR